VRALLIGALLAFSTHAAERFTAVCEVRQEPHVGKIWRGPSRASLEAAQGDAAKHNAENPGHNARVVEGSAKGEQRPVPLLRRTAR
jgi:hypothetical protein